MDQRGQDGGERRVAGRRRRWRRRRSKAVVSDEIRVTNGLINGLINLPNLQRSTVASILKIKQVRHASLNYWTILLYYSTVHNVYILHLLTFLKYIDCFVFYNMLDSKVASYRRERPIFFRCPGNCSHWYGHCRQCYNTEKFRTECWQTVLLLPMWTRSAQQQLPWKT